MYAYTALKQNNLFCSCFGLFHFILFYLSARKPPPTDCSILYVSATAASDWLGARALTSGWKWNRSGRMKPCNILHALAVCTELSFPGFVVSNFLRANMPTDEINEWLAAHSACRMPACLLKRSSRFHVPGSCTRTECPSIAPSLTSRSRHLRTPYTVARN